jgi:hypothetical protein
MGIADVKIYADAFNCATNMRDDNVGIYYFINELIQADEDDPYAEAAVYKLTAADVYNRAYGQTKGYFETNSAPNGKLDDINYRFDYYAD